MATTYLKRTAGTSTENYKYTFSAWVKRTGVLGASSANEVLFSNYADSSNASYIRFEDADDNLQVYDKYGSTIDLNYKTNMKFRDCSGWYHIVVNVDGTRSVNERCKIYVNGSEVSCSSTTDTGGTLAMKTVTTANAMRLGNQDTGGGEYYFNGLMSHVHYIDGTGYDASYFGETDATTGEWKIKTSVSVTYGNNGFSILQDGNTITDQSSNSNDFTLGGGTLTNTEDCPSDVFCTLNPLNNTVSGTSPTLINGNNYSTTGGVSASNFGGSGTLGLKKGVWYYEGLVVTSGNDNLRSVFGINSDPATTAKNNQEAQWNRWSYCWKGYNGGWWTNTNATGGNGTENGSYLNTYTNGDYIGVYFDLDNNKMLFTKNGTLERSGVSMTITAPADTNTGFYFPIYTAGHSVWVSSAKLNFGNGVFGSTALTGTEDTDWFRDAGGKGKFKYNPTQTIDSTTWNARAICLKNINTYG